jgi:hypothetical protein
MKKIVIKTEHEVFNSETKLPKELEIQTISKTPTQIIFALVLQFNSN